MAAVGGSVLSDHSDSIEEKKQKNKERRREKREREREREKKKEKAKAKEPCRVGLIAVSSWASWATMFGS